MDFEDYKTKIQRVSKLLEDAKYPEDVLNNKELNIEEDFQYICLNSNINSGIANEVVIRLAQNGNKQIVENNVRSIPASMWKEIFNKNEQIKGIFIENFSNIIENTGILTYRDIENFVDDNETQHIIYENIGKIIKRLCTYDRAALISSIKEKENGINTIKDNLELFFQKGEYDISTTYSKVLFELGSIEEITSSDILKVCSKYLGEMLSRETAIDNETNELLNWIYDAIEASRMPAEECTKIQQDVDEAILNNFDRILDRTNYDKETIKLLKLFPCTHDKFGSCKDMFLENSSKLVHMTKIYNLGYEKECDIAQEEGNITLEDNGEKSITTEEMYQTADVDVADCTEQNEAYTKVTNDTDDQQFIEEVKEEIETIEQYRKMLAQSDSKEENSKNILEALVKSNLYETDMIIDKVVNRDETTVWNGYAEQIQEANNNNMENTQKFNWADESGIAIDYGENKEVLYIATSEQTAETQADVSIVEDEKALITAEEDAGIVKVFKVIKTFLKKVKNLVYKSKTERIGE